MYTCIVCVRVCVCVHACVRTCVWKAGPGTAGLGELWAELNGGQQARAIDVGDSCAWGFAPRHPGRGCGPHQHQGPRGVLQGRVGE